MKMKFFISFLLIISPLLSNVYGLTCYSCKSCSPGSNGVSITCTAGESCYVGQYSSTGLVDQGCISNIGSILSTYLNLKGCSSDLCNINTYTSLGSSVTYSYTSNSNQNRFVSVLLIFTGIIAFLKLF